MTNVEKLKKIRTAAALAAVAGSMPAIVREAIVCAVDLIEEHERRLARLEKSLEE